MRLNRKLQYIVYGCTSTWYRTAYCNNLARTKRYMALHVLGVCTTRYLVYQYEVARIV